MRICPAPRFLAALSAAFLSFSPSVAGAVCSDGLLGLADSFTIGEQPVLTGTVQTTSATPPCALPSLPAFPTPGTGSMTVNWGSTGTIDTSFHGTVLVHSGSTLFLKPGSYRIAGLVVEWGAYVRVDTSNGVGADTTHPGVLLAVQGDVAFYDGATLQYPGLSDSLAASRIALVVPGVQTISLSSGTNLRAQVIAPQATLAVVDRVQLTGRFLVHKAVIGANFTGRFAASGIAFPWDSVTVVAISGPRRFWTNASSVPVSWTVNGVEQTAQLTETLRTTDGTHWIKRCSSGSCDSVQALVDRTAPVIAIQSPTNHSWSKLAQIEVTWIADGVAQSPSVSTLVEGENSIVRSWTDSAGNVGSAGVIVKLDTHAPEIQFQSPAEGTTVEASPVTVRWSVDGLEQTSFTADLTEGTNTISKSETDSAGNAATATLHVTLASRVPVVTILSPVDGYQTTADSVTVLWSVDYIDQTPVRLPLAMGANLITRTSGTGHAHITVTRVAQPADTVRPGREPVPSSVNLDLLPTFQDRMAFLYAGPDAVQTGVDTNAIPSDRIAVLRGQVLTRDGQPLPGVTVSVLRRPEFGQVKTRADGWFDMVVAVGGRIMVDFQRTGMFPVQREADVSANDFGILPEVRMIAQDTRSTAVSLGSSTQQVVVGSNSIDVDGTRTPVVLIPAGVTAQIVDSNGVSHPAPNLTIRATEYTVGPNGPQTMPGELPPGVAYTYAIELSADEAVAQKAKGITFSQPLPFYVDNFLGFPVGIPVPLGYYDRDKGVWVASASGVIVKIVSVQSGRATVDANGDGLAEREDSLLQNGWTAAELDQLGSRYTAGKSLWRVKIPHFSPWDLNWGVSPPEDAVANKGEPKVEVEDEDCDVECGSVIGVQDRRLGESIEIPGTGESLVYTSSRAVGMNRFRKIKISVSGDSVPASLKAIELQINAGGQVIKQTFPPNIGQSYTFIWNGKDVWGRVSKEVSANIDVIYVYDGVYRSVSSFGLSLGEYLDANRETNEFRLAQRRNIPLHGSASTSWSEASKNTLVLQTRRVQLGSGGVASQFSNSTKSELKTVTGKSGHFQGLQVLSDASFYVQYTLYGDEMEILHYSASGRLLGRIPFNRFLGQLAVLSDGTLLSSGYQGVFKIDTATKIVSAFGDIPLGNTSTINVNSQDEVLVAMVGPNKVYKATKYGESEVVAGGGTGALIDGALATDVALPIVYGCLWLSDKEFLLGSLGYIHKVDSMGRIWRVAGDGRTGEVSGEGGAALDAKINNPSNFMKYGTSICFSERSNYLIRCIDEAGVIRDLAGTGKYAFEADGQKADTFSIGLVTALAAGPDGWLFFTEGTTDYATKYFRVRKIKKEKGFVLPGQIASHDPKSENIWVFNSKGQHQSTINPLTGDTLRVFEYDASGRTTAIRTPFDATRIEYPDANTVRYIGSAPRVPAGVQSVPNARVTTVNKDASGNVTSIVLPDGKTHAFSYKAGGLMETYQKPNGIVNKFTYAEDGSLLSDGEVDKPAQTLSEVVNGDTTRVFHTGASGAQTEYVKWKSGDKTYRQIGEPGGIVTTKWKSDKGSSSITTPTGEVISSTAVSDPQWGMASPLMNTTVRQPDGSTKSVVRSAYVQLADPVNPLSLIRRVDTTKVGNAVTISDWTKATRTLRTVNALSHETVTKFDTKQRVIERTSLGDSLRVSYDDATGIEIWLQNNRTTTIWRDRDGRVDSVVTADGDTLRYVRDGDDQPVGIPQPGNTNVALSWDTHGRLAGLTPAGKPQHQFVYNQWGGDSLYLPPLVNGADGQVGYKYDNKGRLSMVTYSNQESVSAAFDSKSRWSSLSFPQGSIAFTYAQPNNPVFTSAVRTLPGGTTQGLALSLNGNGFGTETWSGEVSGSVTRNMNMQGFLGTLDIAGSAINYTYPMGGVAIPLTAGDASYDYGPTFVALQSVTLNNTKSHLRRLDMGYGPLAADSLIVSNHLTYLQKLTYNPDGRIATKTETISPVGQNPEVVAWAYRYSNGRLVGVDKNGVNVASYGWDANGNRSGTLVDDQDRFVSGLGSSWTYDAVGHLRTRSDSRGAWTFTYDALWNLLSATGPQSISYVVDARGRRVGRKVNGTLVQGFLYGDQLEPVAELNGSGAVVSRFVYGSRPHVPDYMFQGTDKFRIVSDHLGSVRLVINAVTGAVVSRLDYDAWGNITNSFNPSFQPFGFAGGLRDDATGLTQFGARDYDPLVGRWTSKDAVSFLGGSGNLYGYSNEDPINFSDVSGLAPGDRYETPDDAAMNALQWIYRNTMYSHTEFGGKILLISNNGQPYFSYSNPVQGDWNSVAWSTATACPGGIGKQTTVAGYHSHNIYGLPKFSPDDINGARATGIPMYLINSAGKIGKLNANGVQNWDSYLYDISKAYH